MVWKRLDTTVIGSMKTYFNFTGFPHLLDSVLSIWFLIFCWNWFLIVIQYHHNDHTHGHILGLCPWPTSFHTFHFTNYKCHNSVDDENSFHNMLTKLSFTLEQTCTSSCTSNCTTSSSSPVASGISVLLLFLLFNVEYYIKHLDREIQKQLIFSNYFEN